MHVICLPTERLGVQEELVEKCPCLPNLIGIWKSWLLRRGENRISQRKTFRRKGENQQQTQPTHDFNAGN